LKIGVKAWLQPALMILILLGVGLGLRWLGLADWVQRAGERGPGAFVAAGMLACAVGIPRQVVAYAGGLAFGFWPGATLALAAQSLGCAANFGFARLVARPRVVRRLQSGGFQSSGRLSRLEQFLAQNTFMATLTLRLLPVGNNLLTNLMAGASSVPAMAFLGASILGYVPQTVVFALLGGGLRVSQSAQIASAVVLLAVSIVLGLALLRRNRAVNAG